MRLRRQLMRHVCRHLFISFLQRYDWHTMRGTRRHTVTFDFADIYFRLFRLIDATRLMRQLLIDAAFLSPPPAFSPCCFADAVIDAPSLFSMLII